MYMKLICTLLLGLDFAATLILLALFCYYWGISMAPDGVTTPSAIAIGVYTTMCTFLISGVAWAVWDEYIGNR